MTFGTRLMAASLSLILVGPAQAKRAKPAGLLVTIITKPPGAKVYVDGKKNGIVCQSGPACKPLLRRGIHKILMELDGYKSSEETINVGTVRRFAFTLKDAPARLEVKTLLAGEAAQGGEIFVDGQLAGTVPTTLSLAAGKHKVEVRRSGYPSFAEDVDLTAGALRPLLVRLREEPKAGSAEGHPPAKVAVTKTTPLAAAEKAPAPPAAEKTPPPPAVEKGVPVTVVPRNPRYVYMITSNRGPSCATPCIQHIEPGPLALTVSGPGTKRFWQQITVLDSPTQITVQHYTKSRAIAGSILFILGVPMAVLGGIFIANGLGNTVIKLGPTDLPTGVGIGGVLAGHGLIFTVVGIAQLATIKYNTIKVTSTGVSAALEQRPLQFLSAGISPTADRTGASVAASFAF